MPYRSGNTPQKSDTRRMLLAKKLGYLQTLPGALAINNEQRNDTVRRLQTRIVNSENGTATK